MDDDAIRIWVTRYDATVIARVVRRLTKFRDNTPDARMREATNELLDLIGKAQNNG